jgi:hypothetical protein
MHEGCRDDRFFSFRFGVDAGGCMQGRVAYRSRRATGGDFCAGGELMRVDDRELLIENVLAIRSSMPLFCWFV